MKCQNKVKCVILYSKLLTEYVECKPRTNVWKKLNTVIKYDMEEIRVGKTKNETL